MSLTPAEVQKIAHLAHLSISETEIQPLTKDLDNILNLIGKINEIDITKAEPMAHPLDAIHRCVRMS